MNVTDNNATGRSSRGAEAALLVLFLLLGGLITLARGQDNWWDILNYHIYNPWRLLTHRHEDFFVAGIQGYFHPLADVPYYLLAWEWLPTHPKVVGFLAGFPYGALMYLALFITRTLLQAVPFGSAKTRWLVILLTAGLSVTGASAWTQAGTTTNEITVSVVVLAACALLLGDEEASARLQHPWRNTAFFIGALLGTAAGLKLTATFYAPAGGLALLFACRHPRDVLVIGLSYLLGWWLAFSAIYGPWAWHLYQETGNPFFPMFNNYFHSSYSSAVPGRDLISMPTSTTQWIFYPFYWLDASRPSVYNLLPFRDGRFALFYVATVGWLVSSGLNTLRKRWAPASAQLNRVLAFAFFAYLAWLGLFSMLRYAVALEVLCSILGVVLLVRLVTRLQGERGSSRAAQVTAIVATVGLVITTRMPDVHRIDYASRVFEADVPYLGKNPLVIFSDQPMGLLAPLIVTKNPAASFIGIHACFQTGNWCRNGFYDYGLGQEMKARLKSHRGPLYVANYANANPSMPQLAAFGVYPDQRHCTYMTTNVTPDVAICPASLGQISSPTPGTFRLEAQTTTSPGMQVDLDWLSNKCSNQTETGQFALHWRAPASARAIRVYIQAPPSNSLKLFAIDKTSASATTGPWVRAGQDFILQGASGVELARASVHYVPCSP